MLGLLKYKLIDLYRYTDVVNDYNEIKLEVNKGIDYLHELQKRKLSALLIHAKQFVPFYSDRMNKISFDEINLSPYELLKSLPYITKDDFTDNPSAFISTNPPRNILNKTGGSTGIPLTYLVDLKCISRTKAFDLYWWNQAFGYKFGDNVLTIGGSSIGGSQHLKLKVYNYLQSRSFLEGGNISVETLEKNVELICKGRFDVIYAYPSALLVYVEKAKAMNLKFVGRLKGIATTSENLTSTVRSTLESFFKAPVYDVYGARDGGIVADECTQKCGLHYNFQDCYVEELYESKDITVPELILTNLNSYSQPMIRYKVGDLGKITDSPCNCGNPLPRIVEFSGRIRDILLLSNGRTIHGALFNKIVSYFPKIKQFQTVYNQSSLRFNMIVTPDFSIEEEKRFRSMVEDVTGIKDILLDFSGNFEYTEAGKLKTVLTKKE